MQHLHAYWRMEYIEGPKIPESQDLFGDLLNSGNDQEALIVYRSKLAFLILNKYPYNAGHLMAIPVRKVADLSELTCEERIDFMNIIITGQDILTKALSPQGFNIGLNIGPAGGAGVPGHIHCHIVPRWSGDTNFMPVIGKTRVLPQSLAAMWQRLKEFAPENA